MTVWTDLLGAEVKLLQGKRYVSRIVESGTRHSESVILTHAGGGHVETYARNILPLSEGAHVVAIEMLWHGFSDRPPIAEDRIAQEADQITDVMDARGIDAAWVVGHGSGGAVLTWLALNRPDRVKGLILQSTVGNVRVKTNEPAPPPPTPGGRSFAEQTLEVLANPTREGVRARLLPAVHPNHPERITDEMIDIRLALYTRPETNEGMMRYYSSEAHFAATEDQVSRLEIPTLLIGNDARGESGLAAQRRLSGVIPRAQLLVLADTGNWGHWEAPQQFNDAVLQFIKGQKVTGGA